MEPSAVFHYLSLPVPAIPSWKKTPKPSERKKTSENKTRHIRTSGC